MKANLIKIGNSRGIRLPKSVIEECGFEDEVELSIKKKKIVISSPKKPREGWEYEMEKISKAVVYKEIPVFESIDSDDLEGEWEW